MIDTYDTFDVYDKKGSYASAFENKPGRRILKSGSSFEQTEFRMEAHLADGIVAEIKGPSTSSNVEVSPVKVEAMARAEVASASVKAGPVGMKVGLGFDTGASVGPDQLEAKFLGTGVSFGSKNSVSVLGSEVSCSVM
ncbi:hypothetical protein QQF64_020078 [Cirrhinus molitorella]|uniref:Uncharacterized protein n=1 Tax=Cirrhinus molitorella TaxID=172907 RepID=A0ABR3LKY2_9TELE